MNDRWQDRTALITGAASGIGRATSNELAARGAIVYVTDLDLAACQAVVDDISGRGGRAHALALDVNDWAGFKEAIKTVQERHGALDALLNNAGVIYVGEFSDMREASIDKLVRTNVSSLTVGTLYAYRQMKTQGHGLIVNVSSLAGFSPSPAMAVYAATKHAVLGLTQSLATEAEGCGVQLKAVCFSLVESELFDKADMAQGDADTVLAMLPIKPLPASEAARQLVDRLDQRGRIIFVPFFARVMWWTYRFFPALLFVGAPRTMKKFRALVAGD